MSDNETKAISLRTQAMACLQEAEALDGLKPFIITHEHRHGVSTYLAWFRGMPTEEQAAAIIEEEFEPEIEESISIAGNLKLQEVAGVWPSPRNG